MSSSVNVAVDLRDAEAIAETALTLPDRARELVVDSHEAFTAAGAFLVEIRARRVAIAEAFKPSITAAHEAHKKILALCKQADQPAEQAEREIKAKLSAYQLEQDRLRREAEERARRERERQEAEARAEHERQQREAREAAERRQLAEAEAAMDGGDLARAEQLLETPVATPLVAPPAPIVPEPVAAPEAPKAAGVSIRTRWAYRIVEELRIDRRYLMADEKKIGQLVRALGPDAAATVGGIEVFPEPIVSARAR